MTTPMTTLTVSNVCSAFATATVGSKVTNTEAFVMAVAAAVAAHDPATDRVPGQHFIFLPRTATQHVSAGIGKRDGVPAHHYVTREHRGRVDCYLSREHAAQCDQVAVVVYTVTAYRADPEVNLDEVNGFDSTVSHVLVAVLAFAGPEGAPLSPHRFVSNLAGGNREASTYTADEIRTMAKDVIAYDAQWCVVAD